MMTPFALSGMAAASFTVSFAPLIRPRIGRGDGRVICGWNPPMISAWIIRSYGKGKKTSAKFPKKDPIGRRAGYFSDCILLDKSRASGLRELRTFGSSRRFISPPKRARRDPGAVGRSAVRIFPKKYAGLLLPPRQLVHVIRLPCRASADAHSSLLNRYFHKDKLLQTP